MAIRIKKVEWWGLYIVTGIIDFIQFILLWTGAAEVISEFADVVIGILLIAYFEIRGIRMIRHPKRLLSLLGIFVAEEVTGGIAPAWIIDVYYMQRSVSGELEEKEEDKTQQGTTPPKLRPAPVNSEPGVRPPNKV